jgi:signal transduction histidine kinase
VFQPFFRLEPSRSRATGGTGLGLAVARTIVHRHGGEIALDDRPGGGLVVRITLPATGP